MGPSRTAAGTCVGRHSNPLTAVLAVRTEKIEGDGRLIKGYEKIKDAVLWPIKGLDEKKRIKKKDIQGIARCFKNERLCGFSYHWNPEMKTASLQIGYGLLAR